MKLSETQIRDLYYNSNWILLGCDALFGNFTRVSRPVRADVFIDCQSRMEGSHQSGHALFLLIPTSSVEGRDTYGPENLYVTPCFSDD
jgi:hypothetical protein